MTNNLDITQLSTSQNNKETTINDANGELDAALTAVLTKTITSTNAASVSAAELRRASLLQLDPDGGDPPTGAITVTVAAHTRGNFSIFNNTAYDATVEVSGQTATPPTVTSGDVFMANLDGADVRSAGGGAGGGAAVFTDLTDTPSSYTGNGGRLARVNAGETALEFVDSGRTASSVPPFKGARVSKTGVQALSAGVNTALTWDSEDFDADGMHDPVSNNSRLTVPVGSGIKKVALTANVDMNTPSSGPVQLWILKNGGAFPGDGFQAVTAFSGSEGLSVSTGPLAVSEGDYFEVWINSLNAGQVDATSGTNFALTAVETDASGTAVGRPVFKGALVTNSANTLNINGGTVLGFDTEAYDTDGFHDTVTNNSRLTVPAGVTRVQLRAQVAMTDNVVAGSETFINFYINGAGLSPAVQGVFNDETGGFTNRVYQLHSYVLDVAEGDYLELHVDNSSTTNDDVKASETWFAVEVVEDADTAPYDLAGFYGGTPSATTTIMRFLVDRAFNIPAGMTLSQGHAGTGPSAQTDFDVRKNSVSVGTMRFAASGTVASFIMATQTSFSPGDRLDLVTPAALNAIADVSWTIAGRR